MDEIRNIIANYKAEVAEAASEHERQNALEYAFNRILEIIDAGGEV